MYVIPATVQRTVRGLNQLEKSFERAIVRVIAEVGIRIQRDAKTKAPVDYGVLRASIYLDFKGRAQMNTSGITSTGRNSGKVRTSAVIIQRPGGESDRSGLNAIIGSNMDYAQKQEDKHQYMTLAYNRWAPKVKPGIEKAIQEEIKKSMFR